VAEPVNARERQIATRIYGCLNAMTGRYPLNPADMATVSRNLKVVTEAARELMYAMSRLGYQEYEAAEEDLADAERRLGITAPEAAVKAGEGGTNA
jgi:hypothetical protein